MPCINSFAKKCGLTFVACERIEYIEIMTSKLKETAPKEKEEEEAVMVSPADLRKMNQLIEEKRCDLQKWRVRGWIEDCIKIKEHEPSAALSKIANMEMRLLSASRPDAYGDSG